MRTLIKNGQIYDGTLEREPFVGDLLIEDDRIVEIGAQIACADAEVIDAAGRIVAPGFIDLHRHADLRVFHDAFGDTELSQGITTVGMGSCGFSPAPLSEHSDGLYRYMLPTHGSVAKGCHFPTMSAYLEALRALSSPVNLATLQGTGAIRVAVKGYAPSSFTQEEMERAQDYVQQSIDCGLRGFSAGLVYSPENHTTTDELIRMLSPCRGRDLLYMPHMRDEASRLAESVEESLQIARSCEMSLGISHFKALGPDNWGETLDRAIEAIERARNEGMDVTVDFYPYHGTATTLAAILPSSFQDRDFGEILQSIDTPASIDRLRHCYHNPGSEDEIMDLDFRWTHALISGVSRPENKHYAGKTVRECAALAGCADEIEFMAKILASENGTVGMVGLNIDPENIARIARLPYSMLISDSLYSDTGSPHPRLYASFPHMIRHYVQDTGILNLQQAIHKMTQMPAQRMRYDRRGVLQEGWYADVLIFDPEHLGDNATFSDPMQMSTGMDYVFVNGRLAWQGEERLGNYGTCLS